MIPTTTAPVVGADPRPRCDDVLRVAVTTIPASAPAVASGAVVSGDGSVNFSIADFQSDAYNTAWGHSRTFANAPPFAMTNVNGSGMEVDQWPRMIHSGNAVTVIAGGRAVCFDRVRKKGS